ncbi:MAG: 4'-phosphopantetheinyl transferase superfamily protein [Bacteroidota bacterium]
MLYEMLAAKEKARASRFVKETDRQTFIVAKALLRSVLAEYTGVSSGEISFEHGKRQKPRLKNPCNLSIHFNVSHSGQSILFGVSDEEIGIDVEYYKNATVGETDIRNLFVGDEVSFINNQSSPVKTFHSLWTRKEALLKGTSEGISDKIRFVPCLTGTHDIKPGVIASSVNWTVISFDADEFCTASIAYTGLNKQLTFYQLDDYK